MQIVTEGNMKHLGRHSSCARKLLSFFLSLVLAFKTVPILGHANTTIIPTIVVSPSSSDEDNSPSSTNTSSLRASSADVVLMNITRSAIKASRASTLATLLQSQTGVQVNDLYGDGSRVTLSLRGFGDNAFSNVLLLIDGMPWTNPDIGLINLAAIPLAIIDHLEILPASDSVLYGDQAVGGIINIITKKAQKQRRTIDAGYGSFSANQLDASLSDIFTNGIGYSVDGGHAFSDNYRDHNVSQNNNGSLLFSYTGSNIQGFLRYAKFNQHFQLPGVLTAAQAYANPRQAENNFAFSNQDSDFWQGSINKNFSPNGNIKLDAIFTQTLEHNAFLHHSKPVFFDVERRGMNAKAEIGYLFDGLWLEPHSQSGIYWQNADYKFIRNESMASELQEVAAYSEFSFHLSPRFTLTAGGRWAYAMYDLPLTQQSAASQPNNAATATNLALNFDATNEARIFLRRATSYRFPKVDEQTCTLTDKPLETQRGISYEGGINYTKSPFKILAEIYRLLLRDEIISIPIKDSNYWVFNENLDPTKRDGMLADFVMDFGRWGQLTVGGNHVIAKFTTGAYKGKRMPFVSENSYHVAEDFAWHKHWHFMAEGIFNSSRYPINDVENRTPELGGFIIYNFGVGYEQTHYDISLRINNITNKHYYGYVVATYQDKETNLAFYPATGISAFISINFKL